MVFKLIRSVLGIDSSDSADRGDGTDVPVESGSTDAATVDTDAAGSTGSGTDPSDDAPGAAEPADATGASTTAPETDEPAPDTETPAEAAAAGTDASASTGSLTEEPPETDAAAEPAEAAGPTDDTDEPATDDEPDVADDTPVEDVNGIGPAYAQRLTDAGIETVDDLLAADPDEVADATDLSPKRVSRWQDAAESA